MYIFICIIFVFFLLLKFFVVCNLNFLLLFVGIEILNLLVILEDWYFMINLVLVIVVLNDMVLIRVLVFVLLLMIWFGLFLLLG